MSSNQKSKHIATLEGALLARNKHCSELLELIYGKNPVSKIEAVYLVAGEVAKVLNAEGEMVIGDPLGDLLICVCSDYFIYKGNTPRRTIIVKMEEVYVCANAVGIRLIVHRNVTLNNSAVIGLIRALENISTKVAA